MIRGRLAPILESHSRSAAIAACIGAVCGVVVAYLALATCVLPGSGFIGSLATTSAGAAMLVVVGVPVGAVVGFLIGAFEGVTSVWFAQWCASHHWRVASYAYWLMAVLGLLNVAVTAFLCEMALGADGQRWVQFWPPTLALACTAAAIVVTAWLESMDWPEQHSPILESARRAHDPQAREVDITDRHVGLAYDLRDMIDASGDSDPVTSRHHLGRRDKRRMRY